MIKWKEEDEGTREVGARGRGRGSGRNEEKVERKEERAEEEVALREGSSISQDISSRAAAAADNDDDDGSCNYREGGRNGTGTGGS